MTGAPQPPLVQALGFTVALVVLHNAAVAATSAPAISVLLTLGLTGLALTWSRRRGLSWDELGLDPRAVRRGLPFGLAAATGVVAAIALGALLVEALGVERPAATTTGTHLWFRVLVVIPVGVALCEEVLFRGVLLATWDRWLAPVGSVVVTSVAFGAWHVAAELNRLGDDAGAGAALPAVVFTGLASALVLCPLRRRTGLLAAPVLVHAASNIAALLLLAEH